MIKIVTISDTHEAHNDLDIPKSGDIIIHSGDITYRGDKESVEDFLQWYSSLEYEMKILIAGNHDWGFEKYPIIFEDMCKQYGITLLNDSEVIFKGIKIWGSPVQPEFCDWAFNRARTKEDSSDFSIKNKGLYEKKYPFIGTHWDKIPNDVDILVTHGPPFGILDSTYYGKTNVGCGLLLEKIEKVKPVLHIFGHIHENRGVYVDKRFDTPITYVNSSSLDLRYKPYPDKAFVFSWDNLLLGQSRGRD